MLMNTISTLFFAIFHLYIVLTKPHIMENNPNLAPLPAEEKKSPFWQKWDDIKVSLVFFLTGWLTLILFMQFGDLLPEPEWPYYLDEILIVIFSWFVLFVILDAVPGFLYILAVGAALYFTIDYFRPLYEAHKAENQARYHNHEQRQELQHTVDSLGQQVMILHQKVDSLQQQVNEITWKNKNHIINHSPKK